MVPHRAGASSYSPDILLTQNPMILFDFLNLNRQNRYKRWHLPAAEMTKGVASVG
jgi:hypothetical protein